MKHRLLLMFLAGLVVLGLTGCFLAADREINLDIIYPTQRQSEVTVKYRVPPPPDGKVYILWITNRETGNVAKIGRLPPSSRLSIVKVNVNFFATGAVVSIESAEDVAQMSNTWALEAGQTQASGAVPTGTK